MTQNMLQHQKIVQIPSRRPTVLEGQSQRASEMFAHTVLPPIEAEKIGSFIEPDAKSLEKSAKQKKAVTVTSSHKRPKSSSQKKKPSVDVQEKQKEHVHSRWDLLLRQHAKLITPMGLIENVTREPSEHPEHTENAWITAAREIFLLQRALKNPTSCSQFKKFVSLSGGFLENDILFWLEVQKYKLLYKKRTADAQKQRKVNAIINCFISSYLPPALQIDIPQEMANDIIDHRFELDNTLFQKAQLEVFRHLLKHWMAFREYHRKLLHSEKVLSTLDRHRAVAHDKELKYREKLAHEREIERQVREHLAEEHEEGLVTDSTTYPDSLAKQGILTDDQILAQMVVKYTQTVRSGKDSAACDQSIGESGDGGASIPVDELDLHSRRLSSASSQKRSSDTPSPSSKPRTGDPREGPKRVKSVGFVNSTTVK